MFCYTAILKIALNEKGVHPLDMCLIRTLFMLVGSSILAYMMKASFIVEKNDVPFLLLRCLFGTIGFTSITYGVAMVPLVVQNTIFNTAPFWASILGWVINKEKITTLEIIALILSFGGVFCVTFAGHNKKNESEAVSDTSSSVNGSHLLGSCLVLITSWCYASVTILTRRIQNVHFAVMLTYYAMVAFPVTALMIVGQLVVKGG